MSKGLPKAGLKPGQYASLAAVLAVTTVGGYFGYERLAPKPVAAARLVTADVTRGNIVSNVSATGSVASPAQSKLSFKSGGRLAQLFVSVGDQVEEGQPLARIDESDLQVALAQAQANLRSAEAKLEQTKAGAKPEELATAQAQLDSARLKLEQTRAVSQGPELVTAQSQLESAKIKLAQLLAGGRAEDVAAAQAQLDAATAKLVALQNPRPEDLASAQSQLESAKIKLAQLQSPRAEDVRNAEAQLASARARLNALLNPRLEDLASAQSQVDQAQTKLSQLLDQPRTAKPEDIANAELQVKNAQVAYDKALSDSGNVGRTGGPSTSAAADAAVKQALINLETAQNNLRKLQQQGPTEWDVRLAQQSLEAAQANLTKLRNPAPADVQAAQSTLEQAQVTLDKLRNPAQADLVAAQASIEQAQGNLDKLLKPSGFDIQAAQESVNSAQASLDKLRNPSPADVASAQQAVLSARSSLEKLITPTEFDIQAAQQSVLQAQANLDKLLNGNSYDVQTAQFALAQQQANLDLKRNGPTALDILVATASVEQAQAQLKQAEANLVGATLMAPFAGHVSALGANLGEQIGSGTAAVTLVDTRQVRIDVVVDETDVAKIQLGQQVNVSLEAIPGQRIAGRVSMVAPVATVQQGVVNYPVQIQVDAAQARGVRPGMTATAQITTAARENTVVVPNRAVRTQGRNRTVEVLQEDGKAATRPIQVGMTNDQLTEVTGGLQPGDKVVIPSTTTAAARVPGLGGPGGAPAGGFGGGPAPAGNAVVVRP
jgi:HlyD family secretion protein